MKKVIFCAVALMSGAFAFAQYTPGAPAQAVQISNQSPNGNANTGESIQDGDNQKVKVRQVGTKNSAASYQDNGVGVGSNQAFIKQIGNVTSLSGRLNRAEVHQSGSRNESTQMQEGDRNSSLVNQMGDDNVSWARQGTNEQAEKNWVEVQQDGNGNESRTLQTYDNNRALVDQFGDDNKSDIEQRAFSNGTQGHAAEVDQDGNRNQAIIDQDGLGARNEATSIQFGGDNKSYQEQYATSSTNNQGNNALVTQGDGSTTTQIETDLWTNGLLTVDNIANGSFNPGADNSIARQVQYGTNNAVEAQQFGEGNQSLQIQGNSLLAPNSDGNRALVVQNAYGNPAGGGNKAAQLQGGDDNDAAIGQNGHDHTALQVQYGDDNVAMSTQRGKNNNANIWQIGDDSFATTAQRGQCNNAFITQYDGQSYSVEQNLNDGMPYGHNQADIVQQGPGGNNVGLYSCDLPNVDPGTYTAPAGLSIDDICPGC